MTDLDMLIFDEAHNTRGESVMHKIMEDYILIKHYDELLEILLNDESVGITAKYDFKKIHKTALSRFGITRINSDSKQLPKILALSATLYTNDALSVEAGIETVLEFLAGLDIEYLATVTENLTELNKYRVVFSNARFCGKKIILGSFGSQFCYFFANPTCTRRHLTSSSSM